MNKKKEVNVKIEVPEKLQFLFRPKRYKVLYGGRGGIKSWTIARCLIAYATLGKERILCTREYQNSIEESVHKLLSDQIEMMGLSEYYSIMQKSITCHNGSEFIFAGIKTNPEKIKSTEGVTKCWVEEAEKVSENSWEKLIPTIRTPGSEIFVSFNPDEETDPTYKRFVLNPPPNAAVMETSWRDNPWFPNELRIEKDYLASVDPDAYAHVWEGKCRKRSAAQILNGKYVIRPFEPAIGWDGPYLGADWGFAVDPAALVKCWIHDKTLYIEHEYWGVGVEIDHLPGKFLTVPGSDQYVIRADSARPETISYMRRNGFGNMKAVGKWKGSVEDGIAYLRAFEQIVIHPRCVHTAEEARLWSYKVDKQTNDILPEVLDKHNHCWDGVRYALEPIIRKRMNLVKRWDLS